ncbi:MAG: hypothetical protein ACR2MS_08170 [Weeksellaceae bacterium]
MRHKAANIQIPFEAPFQMQKVLWLCVCLLVNISWAQVQTILNPEVILIGDTASLQITVTVDSRQLVEMPQLGDSLTPYLEISHIKTDSLQRGNNLNIIQNITLTGFEPGEFLVKALPIKIDGKIYQSKSYTIQIKDIEVDQNRQGLFPIKPIMEQDITWWERNQKYIYYIIAGVVLALIILLILWLYFKEKRKSKYISTPLLPPYEEALENLKKLDKEAYLDSHKYYEYYSDLSFILRRYFERRFNFSALALLSSDLPPLMKQKEYLTATEATELTTFLKDADYTKYARKIPSEEKHVHYRKWVEEIIYKTRPLLEDNTLVHGVSEEESEKLRKLHKD